MSPSSGRFALLSGRAVAAQSICAVGINSRTCRNDQKVFSGSSQLSRVGRVMYLV